MMNERAGHMLDEKAGHLRPGLRVYAVGDIHGHADLLSRMATLVAEDLSRAAPKQAMTVFLGDYIDRGPASSAVIERLIRRDFPTPFVTLRGNHEQMLLDGLKEPDAIPDWLMNGGAETAESYGLNPNAYTDVCAFSDAIVDALSPSHLRFLEETSLSHAIDGYFFAHAGIQPGVPFEEQSAHDLLWIRRSFHISSADHAKVVVHGHTPVSRPESRPNRINVDTGAFRTGRLTCVALDGSKRRFLST